MKKISKQEKKYTDNNMSVVLERIESQFKIFGESQSLLIDNVNNFKKDVKNQFMAFGEAQDLLSNKVDNIEVKVDKIDERLIRIEDDVVEIKHKLSEKVDLKDFQKLEMRLIKLEKIVFEKV
ncbi:MAG: hypothetical protein U9P70_01570 [Patescibacteria group bacterium]|nr:hypothetical protein [Patescibacteria group bacterium]